MRGRFGMSHMAAVGVTLVGTGCCKRQNFFLLISLNQLRSARIMFDSYTHQKKRTPVCRPVFPVSVRLLQLAVNVKFGINSSPCNCMLTWIFTNSMVLDNLGLPNKRSEEGGPELSKTMLLLPVSNDLSLEIKLQNALVPVEFGRL